MTKHALSAVLAICISAGCATEGSFEPSDPGLSARTNDQELFAMEGLVYGYLLERDFWSEGDFSAVFLKGRDEDVAAFIRKFPHHVPPLKTSDRVKLREASSPIDKETGKPAMLLAAIVSDPSGDTTEAIGTWYAGPAVTGKYVFRLKRVAGTWTIESVK